MTAFEKALMPHSCGYYAPVIARLIGSSIDSRYPIRYEFSENGTRVKKSYKSTDGEDIILHGKAMIPPVNGQKMLYTYDIK